MAAAVPKGCYPRLELPIHSLRKGRATPPNVHVLVPWDLIVSSPRRASLADRAQRPACAAKPFHVSGSGATNVGHLDLFPLHQLGLGTVALGRTAPWRSEPTSQTRPREISIATISSCSSKAAVLLRNPRSCGLHTSDSEHHCLSHCRWFPVSSVRTHLLRS